MKTRLFTQTFANFINCRHTPHGFPNNFTKFLGLFSTRDELVGDILWRYSDDVLYALVVIDPYVGTGEDLVIHCLRIGRTITIIRTDTVSRHVYQQSNKFLAKILRHEMKEDL